MVLWLRARGDGRTVHVDAARRRVRGAARMRRTADATDIADVADIARVGVCVLRVRLGEHELG